MTAYRVGLIVPSSSTTMETDVPAILQLADARVDATALACLEATMSQGVGHHGALVAAVNYLGAKRVARVDTSQENAIVLGACVQVPSPPVLQQVQDQFNIPVLSRLVATAWQI